MEESVPDTPNYRAGADADAEEAETVATVLLHPKTQQTPLSQRFTQMTQPTQIIDRTPNEPSSIVQVAASSPFGPSSSPSRPGGGILSTLMAPSGTQFRPPAQAQKRVPALSDDDRPNYAGGSSDEDELSLLADIKPRTFTKHIARSPEKVMESPVKDAGPNRTFKDLTAAFAYQPSNKRSIDQLDGASDSGAFKRHKQTTISRAMPVADDDATDYGIKTLDDIEDFRMKTQVTRLKNIFPRLSVEAIVQCYMRHRANFDQTSEYLATQEDSARRRSNPPSSPDELSIYPTDKHKPSKQNIKSKQKILDKYSSNVQKADTRDEGPALLKARRLMRGPRPRTVSENVSPLRVSSPVSDTSITKPKGRLIQGKKPKRSATPEEESFPENTDSDASPTEEDTALEKKVLDYINSCTAEGLADLAATTEEMASTIIGQRPFRTLSTVRAVVAGDEPQANGQKKNGRAKKPIGDKVVDKAMEMMRGYEACDALVARCEDLGKPLAAEMKNWGIDMFGNKANGELELVSLEHDSGIGTPATDDGDDVVVDGGRKARFITQPSIIDRDWTLKNYQIVGINWLSLLFHKKLSGILADDMGLGKTFQVIAFLAHLYEQGTTGPHLIVVPSSTLENWLREFKKFCPTLNLMPYYAKQQERADIRAAIEDNVGDINVVITTYTVAKAKEDSRFLRNLGLSVCVFDEGHVLKNSSSKVYDQLIRIPAEFRLLLTGTPLQNNLQELVSLLGFMLPDVFNQYREDLQTIFTKKAKVTDTSDHATLLSDQRIARARSMIAPFVLRRKKHQVIDLPAKTSRVEYCEMNDVQKKIYEDENEVVRKLLADRAAGIKTGNRSANILMKLRFSAIHPLLKRRLYNEKTLSKMAKACLKEEMWSQSDPDIIYEELLPYNDFECHSMCKKYPKSLGSFALRGEEWMYSGKVDKLCELLKKFKANGDRTLIFSQFTLVMDILEYVLETLDMGFFRLDGRTSVEDRQSILDAFYQQTEIPVFMLSTKAGGAGINLACANKVIIFDSSFNPQEDVQAENRAHRVGQVREVEVIRLVTRNTIEEQIYALGRTKLALDQRVVGDDAADSKRTEEVGMKAVEEMIAANIEKKDNDD
ncbi:putative SNF2 family helicase/ATPase [Talaromyces proteolyticus]|uniref:DNA helicase n=1 Tax=Talaromyces proteolyticus TaxID=1131652 RepID=A0AAD4PTY9_9EURO|nr:putative SNF2 family helicase/ATPase [Talaromyces proteolyticus]KAH8694043.1 putative SNF2 family helicase/ATPase [Talaromyces proteolyticus]